MERQASTASTVDVMEAARRALATRNRRASGNHGDDNDDSDGDGVGDGDDDADGDGPVDSRPSVARSGDSAGSDQADPVASAAGQKDGRGSMAGAHAGGDACATGPGHAGDGEQDSPRPRIESDDGPLALSRSSSGSGSDYASDSDRAPAGQGDHGIRSGGATEETADGGGDGQIDSPSDPIPTSPGLAYAGSGGFTDTQPSHTGGAVSAAAQSGKVFSSARARADFDAEFEAEFGRDVAEEDDVVDDYDNEFDIAGGSAAAAGAAAAAAAAGAGAAGAGVAGHLQGEDAYGDEGFEDVDTGETAGCGGVKDADADADAEAEGDEVLDGTLNCNCIR